MTNRESFLRALEANEDDITTRLVYADWLEERGEYEEAQRQRQWPAAKAWLVHFCAANNHQFEDNEYYPAMPYENLIPLARRAAEKAAQNNGDFYIECGANEEMCDALRQHSGEFWRNWSIVTGIPVPADIVEKAFFGCAC